MSVVTHFELLAGCRNQREQQALANEMRLYRTLWLTQDACRTALTSYRQFHLSHGVGFLDCLIAASAVRRGLIVATLNTKHFTPIPALRLQRLY